MSRLAGELGVVLPISFFERANNAYFNSIAVIDADGRVLGLYRKSHIPHGAGYHEKFYFNPGDTGFRVWQTRVGCIGVGICWDQWFPEAARVMVLMGAELLFYPTAIGSEPEHPDYDSCGHWQRVMQGHAGANMVPVIASNRVGSEEGESCSLEFYGSSFITDGFGDIVDRAPREGEAVVTAAFDLDALASARAAWGLFRDRRPDLYVPILSVDGQEPSI
jgi:N-carbamoylputrescine amidase